MLPVDQRRTASREFVSSDYFSFEMPFWQRDDRNFEVVIYEEDYKELCAWVLRKPNIETGGDLFGLWADKHKAVIQLALGPGKGCRRTSVSFYQDVKYLEQVGSYLTQREGICHIGEWHSHHQLGLARPSGGDENTVWNNMPTYNLSRFVIFIANIDASRHSYTVNIGCFLFEIDSKGERRPVLPGTFKILPREIQNPLSRKKEVKEKRSSGEEEKRGDGTNVNIKDLELKVDKGRKPLSVTMIRPVSKKKNYGEDAKSRPSKSTDNKERKTARRLNEATGEETSDAKRQKKEENDADKDTPDPDNSDRQGDSVTRDKVEAKPDGSEAQAAENDGGTDETEEEVTKEEKEGEEGETQADKEEMNKKEQAESMGAPDHEENDEKHHREENEVEEGIKTGVHESQENVRDQRNKEGDDSKEEEQSGAAKVESQPPPDQEKSEKSVNKPNQEEQKASAKSQGSHQSQQNQGGSVNNKEKPNKKPAGGPAAAGAGAGAKTRGKGGDKQGSAAASAASAAGKGTAAKGKKEEPKQKKGEEKKPTSQQSTKTSLKAPGRAKKAN